MKAIIAILIIALAVVSVLLYIRTKQVKSLTAEYESVRKTCDDIAVKFANHQKRVVRLCSIRPKNLTAQALAMKFSNLLDGFFVVDGDTCHLDVLTPEKKEDHENDNVH